MYGKCNESEWISSREKPVLKSRTEKIWRITHTVIRKIQLKTKRKFQNLNSYLWRVKIKSNGFTTILYTELCRTIWVFAIRAFATKNNYEILYIDIQHSWGYIKWGKKGPEKKMG